MPFIFNLERTSFESFQTKYIEKIYMKMKRNGVSVRETALEPQEKQQKLQMRFHTCNIKQLPWFCFIN